MTFRNTWWDHLRKTNQTVFGKVKVFEYARIAWPQAFQSVREEAANFKWVMANFDKLWEGDYNLHYYSFISTISRYVKSLFVAMFDQA